MLGKVHFIGIGGVGMAALAVLAKEQAEEVSGCDLNPSKRTRWLEGKGIHILNGHSPAHVANADLVVVTPAVSRDNPELLAARKSILRGELLAKIVSECESIAVCGSHGKTTTSTFIAKLLLALGEKVGWAIGGETGDFPVAEPPPRDGVLVVEADESDGTLAFYHPSLLVVTNCEYDHPDFFKTPEAYFACFNAARANAEKVLEGESLLPFDDVAIESAIESLSPHNRANARTAVAVALLRGHSSKAIAAALPSAISALPDRRFQLITSGVYTDYGHHPTEIKCAISMARKICSGKLRVVFQPHRYSRTKALLKDFPNAFKGADEVVLCPTYAAFEKPVSGGSVADLYAECRKAGVAQLHLARSCREAWEHVRNRRQDCDVALLLGAGDIINLVPEILAGELVSKRRIFIGAGTNTWKSDMNLDEEYVRTGGSASRSGALLSIPWMVGIPGTIGGWVKMNAGAFGHSISEVISHVNVDGMWKSKDECGFGYRTSKINGEIRDVRFDESALAKARADSTDYFSRRKRFPAGTKGSVFKNPPDGFAGRLLEEAGAKSLRVGGAFVWKEHANVIVAGEGATASDFLALASLMRDKVFFRFGILLEPEVCGLVFEERKEKGLPC